MLLGGLLVAAVVPWAAAAPAIITNPGFEEGLTGWVQAGEFPSDQLSVDSEVKHGGQASLRISGKDNQNPGLAQGIAPIQPQARYRLAAFARSREGEAPALAAVKIEFYDAQNHNISGYYGTVSAASDGTWHPVEVIAIADEAAVKAAIVVRLIGPGTVWFDDVEFIMTEPPPLVAVVPRELTVAASEAEEIGIELRLPQAPEQTPSFRFFISGPRLPEPLSVQASVQRANEQVFDALVSIPELAPGVYELVITDQEKKAQGKASLVSLPAEHQPRGLSEDGHLVADEKPFFPIGLYHVNGDDYAQVAGAGFNCVQGPYCANAQQLKEAIDAAQQAGLKIAVPLYNQTNVPPDPQAAVQKVSELAGDPTILLWQIGDEPDLRPDLYPQIADLYLRLRAIPDHQPLQITVAHPAQYRRWAPLCEVLAATPYPLPNKPLSVVSDFVSQAHRAAGPGQGIIALLPAGWSSDLSTQPTLQQARRMMYLALLNGACGIFWYCLHDPGWDLMTTPLWSQFGQIDQELGQLASVVLSGQRVADIECTAENVILHGFRAEDTIYILMVNNTQQPAEGRVQVPSDIAAAHWLGSGQEIDSRARVITFSLPAQAADTMVVTAPAP